MLVSQQCLGTFKHSVSSRFILSGRLKQWLGLPPCLRRRALKGSWPHLTEYKVSVAEHQSSAANLRGVPAEHSCHCMGAKLGQIRATGGLDSLRESQIPSHLLTKWTLIPCRTRFFFLLKKNLKCFLWFCFKMTEFWCCNVLLDFRANTLRLNTFS